MTADPLYRISRYSNPLFRTNPADKPSINLFARPVFAGPDAAIEVEGEAVKGFITGKRSDTDGQLEKFIEHHRNQIMAAGASTGVQAMERIIFSGTWHHIDFSVAPRFEGCLTHVIATDGSVTSKPYDEQIFEWDATPYRAGYGFTTSMYGGLDVFKDALHEMADYNVCEGRGRYKGRSGLGMVGGMIWLTSDAPQVPVLYSAATCNSEVEFELDEEEEQYLTGQPIIGDGSILAAVLSKSRNLDIQGGSFRGKDVERSSHRPRKLKLWEVPDAIDAIGYWVQVRSKGREISSEFRFFGGASQWWHEVLERTSDVEDDHLLGNLYASDWIFDPTANEAGREIRLLALGPIPSLSLSPL